MSNKFSSGLVKGYREEQEEQARQEQLKKKYEIPDEDVIVVEKSNTFKFTVNLLIRLLKSLAFLALILLAFIGLMGIIYPVSRAELWNIALDIWEQVRKFLPFL